ncbi:MAG TPA: phosphatase PAP2 family protein [Mycobacteriales bacterium]|jgi:membrane-associated phospholipid phosphatase|nr:phosphatase PAP2 family protein [Mycobacteriales bacterium]
MTLAFALFVAGIAIIVVVGGTVGRLHPSQQPAVRRGLNRLVVVRETCRDQLGNHLAALAILFAGAAATIAVCWPLGRFARRYKSNIDAPFIRWTQRHVSTHGTWHHLNSGLTLMGNRPEIKVICVVAIVVFGALWAIARRGWWIPPLLIVAAFGMEKAGQMVLKAVVARPATTFPDFGSYPSGGCARLITVYGTVFFLVLLTWPRISRAWRVTGWTVLAALAFTEGYTRIYLIKHWGMDVVGGFVFGALMLLSLIAAASCFALRETDADIDSAYVEVPSQAAATRDGRTTPAV